MSLNGFCNSSVKQCQQMIRPVEKKYPIGGYAPGNYDCKCCTCGEQFSGDKRAVQCEPCAVSNEAKFDALSPVEQEELVKRDVEMASGIFKGSVKFDSHWMIGRSEERFKELEHKGWDWRSFYNGWIEGRADAVTDVLRREESAATGAVWVKGAPKEFKPHYAKVPSRLYDHTSYKAIIIPKDTPGYWWAVGDGFAYGLISEEIIEHLDESAGEKDDWISVDDQLPEESGRYWCYVEHQADLGLSYFQWNCDYNAQLKRFSDMTLKDGEQVTHWRELPAGPRG